MVVSFSKISCNCSILLAEETPHGLVCLIIIDVGSINSDKHFKTNTIIGKKDIDITEKILVLLNNKVKNIKLKN